MKILVNGREAVLKANASFEYVSENPLFTEAEDYTMEIPFPMKDCPQNISIFGPLHVKGVDISKVSFPCEIQTDAFVKSGILTITSVSETEVQGQFLEGMSQENFASSLPDVYLTDLDFSQWDGSNGSLWRYDVASNRWISHPGEGWAFIPVNDSEDDAIIESISTEYGEDDVAWINLRIYLYYLLDLVGRVIGWSVDYSVLDKNPAFRNIVVVNARHNNYYDRSKTVRPLAYSLPKWKVRDFFDKLALFFGCCCEVDANAKVIKFSSFSDMIKGVQSFNVTDNFGIEVVENDEIQFKPSKSLTYPDDCDPEKIDNCPWLLNDTRVVLKKSLTSDYLLGTIDQSANDRTNWYPFDKRTLYYLTDLGQYAIITKEDSISTDLGEHTLYTAKVINQFNFDKAGSIESKVSPCPTTGYVSIDRKGFEGLIPSIKIPKRDPDGLLVMYDDQSELPEIIDLLAEDTDDKSMWFDNLWLCYYDGERINTKRFESRPIPIKDGDDYKFYTYYITESTYFFNPRVPFVSGSLPKVDETKLYRYKFLAQTLPSPTSVFLIKGKRYACLKLTAQITVKGMSELVEGEFYEIID